MSFRPRERCRTVGEILSIELLLLGDPSATVGMTKIDNSLHKTKPPQHKSERFCLYSLQSYLINSASSFLFFRYLAVTYPAATINAVMI